MNYLYTLNAFNKKSLEDQLSSNANLLYYKLLHIWNSNGRNRTFYATIDSLLKQCNIRSHKTLGKARTELIDKGYITYIKGHKKAASVYMIINLNKEDSESLDDSVTEINDKSPHDREYSIDSKSNLDDKNYQLLDTDGKNYQSCNENVYKEKKIHGTEYQPIRVDNIYSGKYERVNEAEKNVKHFFGKSQKFLNDISDNIIEYITSEISEDISIFIQKKLVALQKTYDANYVYHALNIAHEHTLSNNLNWGLIQIVNYAKGILFNWQKKGCNIPIEYIKQTHVVIQHNLNNDAMKYNANTVVLNDSYDIFDNLSLSLKPKTYNQNKSHQSKSFIPYNFNNTAIDSLQSLIYSEEGV